MTAIKLIAHIFLFAAFWPIYIIYWVLWSIREVLSPSDRLEHANEQAEARLRKMGS